MTFTGTVRDHSRRASRGLRARLRGLRGDGGPRRRPGSPSVARQRWPDVGRIVMLHRTGRLAVTDAAVVVAVSAPHRQVAFDAAHFCIDTVKATVPIWKREVWRGGEDWGACHLEGDGPGSEPSALPSGRGPPSVNPSVRLHRASDVDPVAPLHRRPTGRSFGRIHSDLRIPSPTLQPPVHLLHARRGGPFRPPWLALDVDEITHIASQSPDGLGSHLGPPHRR